jgi:hypothetical protein
MRIFAILAILATQHPAVTARTRELDVDPEIAPDESFMVFVSAGRNEGNSKDHLFYVKRTRATEAWSTPVALRYAGDEKVYAYSGDDDPRLSRDGHTLYFSSDRPSLARARRRRKISTASICGITGTPTSGAYPSASRCKSRYRFRLACAARLRLGLA